MINVNNIQIYIFIYLYILILWEVTMKLGKMESPWRSFTCTQMMKRKTYHSHSRRKHVKFKFCQVRVSLACFEIREIAIVHRVGFQRDSNGERIKEVEKARAWRIWQAILQTRKFTCNTGIAEKVNNTIFNFTGLLHRFYRERIFWDKSENAKDYCSQWGNSS